MKRNLIFSLLLGFSISVFGQSYDFNGDYKISGKLGVGTLTPRVNADINTRSTSMLLPNNSGSTNTAVLRVGYSDYSWAGVQLDIGINNANDYPAWIQARNPADYSINRNLLLNPNGGNIGIGTISPKEKLEVEGTGRFVTQNTGLNYLIKIGGSTHTVNNAVGIGFDPEGHSDSYLNRIKTAIVVEGDGSGWSRGKLHILQSNNGTSSPATLSDAVFTIDGSGKVGIGTTNPEAKLHIGEGKLRLGASGTSTYTDIEHSANQFSIITNSEARPLVLGTNSQEYMRIRTDGSIGIGTTVTGTHTLAVEGTIGAREIKVEASGWSDFVFENDYKLPTLIEVENHIKEKGHLKDIPSAKNVDKNGICLGEMDAKLLQKIEELTLYMIEQSKKTNTLIERVNKLEKENQLLKQKSQKE